MKKEIAYRLGGVDTAAQQADLFNRVFDQCATAASWKRKYLDNPLSNVNTVMCAFDGDKVVGINGFVPMEYECEGTVYRVVQSCDTAVDPEYRGCGIFSKMIVCAQKLFAEEGYDAMVGYPNGNSYHGFLKLGWEEQARTMKYFYPCCVKKVAEEMLSKNLPGFLDPLANMWRVLHTGRYSGKKSDYAITRSEHINAEEYLSFLENEGFRIRITQEYLDWKLSAGYFYYTVRHNAEPICKVLVCSYTVKEGFLRGNILGIKRETADKTELSTAFALLLKELFRQYDVLSVWESGDVMVNEVLRRVGFIKNFSAKDGSPFIVKPLSNDQAVREHFLRHGAWHPSFIEADYVLDQYIKE